MSDKTFLRWLDGEEGYGLKTELKDNKVKSTAKKAKADEKEQLSRFNKIYGGLAVAISVLMVVILCVSIITFPTYGSVNNPTNNEVVERYVGSAHDETGAENVIAGMILNYRGFDTFTDSLQLFTKQRHLYKARPVHRSLDSGSDDYSPEKTIKKEKSQVSSCIMEAENYRRRNHAVSKKDRAFLQLLSVWCVFGE